MYAKSRITQVLRPMTSDVVYSVHAARRLQQHLRKTGYSNVQWFSNSLWQDLNDSFEVFRVHGHESLGTPVDFLRKLCAERPDALQTRSGQQPRAFSIATDTGNGKTVFGMLLPILCSRSTHLGIRAHYVGPALIGANRETAAAWSQATLNQYVDNWLKTNESDDIKLIVFDALNEWADQGLLSTTIKHTLDRYDPSSLRFLFLYRPRTATFLDQDSPDVSELISNSVISLSLDFDHRKASHCTVFTRLFPHRRLTAEHISVTLQTYAQGYHGYTPTRLSAVHVLQHLDRVSYPAQHPTWASSRQRLQSATARAETDTRGSAARLDSNHQVVSDTRPLPPWDVSLDAIIYPTLDAANSDLSLAAAIAFWLIDSGTFTRPASCTKLSAYLGVRVYDRLKEAQPWLRERTALQIDLSLLADTVQIPNEAHLQVLAALHLASELSTSRTETLSTDLMRLRGRTDFDSSARYVLPAFRRLRLGHADLDSGALYENILTLTNLSDAPFSFCARIICSNFDYAVLTRDQSAELSNQLFGKLLTVIDQDRARTCYQSIYESQGGPNPILDQLFAVVDVYGDDAFEILLDDVLLSETSENLLRSQGAYMTLYRLEGVFDAESGSTANGTASLRHRRIHVLNTLLGLEKLRTDNLHIRFHVVEILALLAEKHDDLDDMRQFAQRLELLLGKYGEPAAPTPIRDDATLSNLYDQLNLLICGWATALRGGESQDWFTDVAQSSLPNFMLTTKELAAQYEILTPDSEVGPSLSPESLDQLLECYECLLGLVRRAYSATSLPILDEFLRESVDVSLWIVRWWAFYNVVYVLRDSLRRLPGSTRNEELFRWLVSQLHRAKEPAGLKHRQCVLVERAAEACLKASEDFNVGAILCDGQFSDRQYVADIATIIQSRDRAESIVDGYFRRLRRLNARFC
jgi:hypothetical protein